MSSSSESASSASESGASDSGMIVGVLVYREAPPSRDAAVDKNEANLVAEALKRIRAVFGEVPVYSNRPFDGEAGESDGSPALKVVSGNITECLREALEDVPGAGPEEDRNSMAIFREWHPLLDPEPLREALTLHLRYLAHYTYSENLPPGLMPDFASREFVKLLGEKKPDDLRAFAYKNINDYDVELYYKLPDLRQYRLDLTCATARSRRLAGEMLARNADFAGLPGIIEESPELMRPLPSYFEIEVSTHSRVRPVFTPRASKQVDDDGVYEVPRHMDMTLIEKLAGELEEHGLENDATIALAGAGEPLLHPEIASILGTFLKSSRVTRVYLETYGAELDGAFIRSLREMEGIEKLHIIFRLTTLKRERYQELYSEDLLSIVMSKLEAIEKLSEAERPFTVYAEMLKITDVQDELTEYFDRFEASPVQVILQKFNSYIGRVPERRVSDLTPLHRDFCWHLARDFFMTVAGRVPVCKQDSFAEGKALDYRELSIMEIRERTMPYHADSVRGNHEAVPASCLKCDEWYTFNG